VQNISPLWAQPLTLDEIRRRYLSGCDRHLGVELLAIGPTWLEGRVPTTERTRDAHGVNYGAAIAVLAETLGSIAANLCVTADKRGVGQSLEVHYLLPVTAGPVTGRASPVSSGGPTHIWHIDLRDAAGTLVSIATLSIAILEPSAPPSLTDGVSLPP
jgi:1,4-dihydroxy-2-naphthoyl-CoA hydrolase